LSSERTTRLDSPARSGRSPQPATWPPAWPHWPDPELFTGPALLTALDGSAGEEIRRAGRRSEARRQIACALIDGRLTLQQAAAQFQVIDAGVGDQARRWRPPEYTEEEWPYRQVISSVRAEFEVNRRAPAQAEAWVCRLEAELREHLRHTGAPPPAPGS
jgi:hypothetical protein